MDFRQMLKSAHRDWCSLPDWEQNKFFRERCMLLWRKLREDWCERLSGFSRTGGSTSSIAWRRWLLWNKWILQSSKKDLYEQDFDGEANRLGVVNFHCMHTNESCDEHAAYFWRWSRFYPFSLESTLIEALTLIFVLSHFRNKLQNTILKLHFSFIYNDKIKLFKNTPP